MTPEHTLLGVYLLTIGSGVFTGMTLNIISLVMRSRRSSAFNKDDL